MLYFRVIYFCVIVLCYIFVLYFRAIFFVLYFCVVFLCVEFLCCIFVLYFSCHIFNVIFTCVEFLSCIFVLYFSCYIFCVIFPCVEFSCFIFVLYIGSSLKHKIYFPSSYTQNLIKSGKNGHYIELNKVTIPIFSKLICVKVISAQTLYIPGFKSDVWNPGKKNLKFYGWNVLYFLRDFRPYV